MQRTASQSLGQRALKMMEPWIAKSEPFLLVGPEGCGKDMIIRHAFSSEAVTHGGGREGARKGSKKVKTTITVLHCNARTTAEHVIAKARKSGFRDETEQA